MFFWGDCFARNIIVFGSLAGVLPSKNWLLDGDDKKWWPYMKYFVKMLSLDVASR